MNGIQLIGTITKECEQSYKRYGIIFYEMEISCKRSSGIQDEIRVITAKQCDIPAGKKIFVDGTIQTENYEDENGKHLKVYVYSDCIYEMYSEDSDTNEGKLSGRICKIKPIRQTPTGKTIIDFIMAIDTNKRRSYYIPMVAWGVNAEIVAAIPVGTTIECTGRLQSRNYIKNNETKTVMEFSVDKITQ